MEQVKDHLCLTYCNAVASLGTKAGKWEQVTKYFQGICGSNINVFFVVVVGLNLTHKHFTALAHAIFLTKALVILNKNCEIFATMTTKSRRLIWQPLFFIIYSVPM